MSSAPLPTAQKEWWEKPPHRKEGPTHSGIKGAEARQHPGEMGPQRQGATYDLLRPGPLFTLLIRCTTPPGAEGGKASNPSPSLFEWLQTAQVL